MVRRVGNSHQLSKPQYCTQTWQVGTAGRGTVAAAAATAGEGGVFLSRATPVRKDLWFAKKKRKIKEKRSRERERGLEIS